MNLWKKTAVQTIFLQALYSFFTCFRLSLAVRKCSLVYTKPAKPKCRMKEKSTFKCFHLYQMKDWKKRIRTIRYVYGMLAHTQTDRENDCKLFFDRKLSEWDHWKDKMHLRLAFLSISRCRYVKETTSVEFQSILCSTTIPFCTTLSLSSSFNEERRLIRLDCNESNWNQFSDAAPYLIAALQYLFGTSFGSGTWLFDYLGVVNQFAVFVVVVATAAAAAVAAVCSTLNHVSLLFLPSPLSDSNLVSFVAVLFFDLFIDVSWIISLSLNFHLSAWSLFYVYEICFKRWD